jgi:hypothetical protein
MKKTTIKIASPCDNCKDVGKFSFTGCAVKCQKFLTHLKEVFSKNESPCKDFRCAVPGVSAQQRERCRRCPLPEIYSKRVGEGYKCPLGKTKNRGASWVYPYEGKYPWEGKY